jgi:coproporphyrinogen III oxidase-like Fe-S oxidoreductase
LPVDGDERLDAGDLLRERLLLGLRMGELDPEPLRRDFHFDLYAEREPELRRLLDDEALVMDEGGIRLTRKGYLLCDAIAAMLL